MNALSLDNELAEELNEQEKMELGIASAIQNKMPHRKNLSDAQQEACVTDALNAYKEKLNEISENTKTKALKKSPSTVKISIHGHIYLILLILNLKQLIEKNTSEAIEKVVGHLSEVSNILRNSMKTTLSPELITFKVVRAVNEIHDGFSTLIKENTLLHQENEELKFRVELLEVARKIRAPIGSDIEKAALQVATLRIKKLVPIYEPTAKRGRKKIGAKEEKAPEIKYIDEYIRPELKKIGLEYLAEEARIYSAAMPDFYKSFRLQQYRASQ